jgi:dephospho-CoA kinase
MFRAKLLLRCRQNRVMEDLRPIGLTGSIAGGKSTVLAMLAEMGLRTASSDAVAREIFNEKFIQDALAERQGAAVPVAPAALREAMLQDPGLRRWINRLMHPLVGERVAALEADVVEVPLLFEACLQNRYREVWAVACGPEERSRRLRARYGPEADLEALEAWQLPERVKMGLADRVIRTDGPIEAVHRVLTAEVTRCFPSRIALPK